MGFQQNSWFHRPTCCAVCTSLGRTLALPRAGSALFSKLFTQLPLKKYSNSQWFRLGKKYSNSQWFRLGKTFASHPHRNVTPSHLSPPPPIYRCNPNPCRTRWRRQRWWPLWLNLVTFGPNPHRTRDAMQRKWNLLMWMGVSTLHASNIKGKMFEFTHTSRPASCVDWV